MTPHILLHFCGQIRGIASVRFSAICAAAPLSSQLVGRHGYFSKVCGRHTINFPNTTRRSGREPISTHIKNKKNLSNHSQQNGNSTSSLIGVHIDIQCLPQSMANIHSMKQASFESDPSIVDII